MALLTLLFVYFCYQLFKQFGWSIYKRIGADIEQQEKYFALLGITNRKFIGYVIHIILTVLLIPGLFLARFGVISENKQVMLCFLFTQVVMVLDFLLILVDSAGSWVFWNLAVCLAIVLCVATILLSVMVSRNFGKGLKPYMQRLFIDENDKKGRADHSNHGALLHKKEDWLIDEDEDYVMTSTQNATIFHKV
ncbi:hypothetical protein BDF20DRAFT_846183 [Mycotypha africana]|uniref:uncharacterized protein n=1 Tax=Mycotypha africana TaxID=64632 RepID=UPI0023011B99|nr:uncharacterized protein BDF20DRAFT_846183 [Mycotypha africana]KAI8991743.1 hypothetical protein BDF20DRAFT_846183 [Mycotypha africana]